MIRYLRTAPGWVVILIFLVGIVSASVFVRLMSPARVSRPNVQQSTATSPPGMVVCALFKRHDVADFWTPRTDGRCVLEDNK
jgi:hypothetical protein